MHFCQIKGICEKIMLCFRIKLELCYLNTPFWLAGMCAFKLFNAQVSSQFNLSYINVLVSLKHTQNHLDAHKLMIVSLMTFITKIASLLNCYIIFLSNNGEWIASLLLERCCTDTGDSYTNLSFLSLSLYWDKSFK